MNTATPFNEPVLADPSPLVRAFADHTLPRSEWTHAAHVEVCWAAVRALEPDAALDNLRDAIRAYNVATGGTNTDHAGYHETLTRYYVLAVDHVARLPGAVLTDALAAPCCHREAPARHWSRDMLMSVAARRRWISPDLAPLPWDGVARTRSSGGARTVVESPPIAEPAAVS